MTTNNVTGTQFPTTTSTGGSTSSTNSSLNLSASDFVNIMVTQLQNQDPLNPTDSGQLLTQISQIGQLESSTQLQSSLTNFVQQSQIGAASALIGKTVTGNDSNNNPVSGTVTSVSVNTSGAGLILDSGSTLPLGSITNITNPSAASTASSTAGSASSTGTTSKTGG
jgi:flagellar basal-body rod modification protein FlgD